MYTIQIYCTPHTGVGKMLHNSPVRYYSMHTLIFRIVYIAERGLVQTLLEKTSQYIIHCHKTIYYSVFILNSVTIPYPQFNKIFIQTYSEITV